MQQSKPVDLDTDFFPFGLSCVSAEGCDGYFGNSRSKTKRTYDFQRLLPSGLAPRLRGPEMSEKIGRFEIASQLAQSPFATVYKTTDTESQQTVALKVVRLDSMADRAAFMKAVFEEAERAKPLRSHNIAGLYGVGDEGDLLLAAAEYVQGNSVATTLARHEGFSIWDLQDIARQACQGLDHAHGHNVIHVSLEPAKIMV